MARQGQAFDRAEGSMSKLVAAETAVRVTGAAQREKGDGRRSLATMSQARAFKLLEKEKLYA